MWDATWACLDALTPHQRVFRPRQRLPRFLRRRVQALDSFIDSHNLSGLSSFAQLHLIRFPKFPPSFPDRQLASSCGDTGSAHRQGSAVQQHGFVRHPDRWTGRILRPSGGFAGTPVACGCDPCSDTFCTCDEVVHSEAGSKPSVLCVVTGSLQFQPGSCMRLPLRSTR